jgi:hypothetical protein
MRAIALIALAAGGCYSPTLLDCTISCGPGESCPSGLTCGADRLCHVDVTKCAPLPVVDAAVKGGAIDARPVEGQPDAEPECDGSDIGEPDDSCPGEQIGPILEGTHITVEGRTIFPAGDVDVYTALVTLAPHVCTSGDKLNYALRVSVTPPPATNLAVRRISADSLQCRPTDSKELSFCATFTEPCNAVLTPSITFEVDGLGDAASCTPYTLDVTVCAAGSTCDHSKQL